MERRQLEYFVAVAEETSFTRAARRERVAQPAVSAQIQRLERAVGQPLLHRSAGPVRLTSAGEALLPHARAALAALRDGQSAVDEVTGLLRGVVAIGTVTAHPVEIARLMADFIADHPAIEMTLVADASDALVDKLADGRLDVAIVSIGVDEGPPGLDFEVITDESIEAAVAPRHALGRRKVLRLDELCDHPVISLPVGTGLRSRFDTACAAAGLRPHIAFEASSPVELVEMARYGLGVAVLPQSMARGRTNLHAMPVSPELRGRLVWAWRRDRTNPAARRFCERARRMIASGVAVAPVS
ncbi:HTH-type transcriptional regulator CynR [Mycolicibacterium vanbaalenii]|uniref:Probable hydrogen peroxide-inducible genes activator n=1 Tax=Mycolicibacterium vanbaalenii TaxID=110539 RepID=A0A5S9QW06_MYCVN|nr:LysR family transcriptional regulator [Mycolicibacterium vanbaalenii]CAA0123877.1 HTH-type transcriptional regulator CynR [Mycolicibacterium vanbaalenii]